MKKSFFFSISFFLFSCAQPDTLKIVNSSPSIDSLSAGNNRFVKGSSIHPHETLKWLRELKKGQHPSAIVLSCSDSRITPELIFDQGLGDIFSIRTAGNVIGDYELGSIEYAVEHLNCKLLIVLGHENCGAIEAFISSEKEIHENHIQNIINYIADEVEEKEIKNLIKANPDLAIRANIKHAVTTLKNSNPILSREYQKGELKIIGAYYDLDTGKVSFDQE